MTVYKNILRAGLVAQTANFVLKKRKQKGVVKPAMESILGVALIQEEAKLIGGFD